MFAGKELNIRHYFDVAMYGQATIACESTTCVCTHTPLWSQNKRSLWRENKEMPPGAEKRWEIFAFVCLTKPRMHSWPSSTYEERERERERVLKSLSFIVLTHPSSSVQNMFISRRSPKLPAFPPLLFGSSSLFHRGHISRIQVTQFPAPTKEEDFSSSSSLNAQSRRRRRWCTGC